MAATAISVATTPVLYIDTCSILDIMRDPVRKEIRPDHRRSTLHLLAEAEAGRLTCLMAEQVALEFAVHDTPVQEDTARSLKNLRDQIERFNELATIYGASPTMDLTHLDDHLARARAIVTRWLAQLQTVVPGAQAPAKAFARVNAGIAPAKRGKDSSKDCLIYETLLEHAAALRAAGTTTPLVFLSSNTAEYFTEGHKLKPEIAAEFAPFNLAFAPNMSAARHELGL